MSQALRIQEGSPMSHPDSPRVVEIVAEALKDMGVEFDAAVILVRSPDSKAQSGFAIVGGCTGDLGVVSVLLYDTLRKMLPEAIVVDPDNDGEPLPLSAFYPNRKPN